MPVLCDGLPAATTDTNKPDAMQQPHRTDSTDQFPTQIEAGKLPDYLDDARHAGRLDSAAAVTGHVRGAGREGCKDAPAGISIQQDKGHLFDLFSDVEGGSGGGGGRDRVVFRYLE